jgi:hypothetical protein
VLRRLRGCRGWLEMKRKTRRTCWWGCGQEIQVREGREAEERLQTGRDNSTEKFLPLREAIDCDRARSSSGGGGGALWANIGAQDGVRLAGHHASAASKRGRTPSRPNWL